MAQLPLHPQPVAGPATSRSPMARLRRDLLLVLGLGIAIALLRAASAGAAPGGVELPPAGDPAPPPTLAAEPSPVTEALDAVVAPVRQVLDREPGAGPAASPRPVAPPAPTPPVAAPAAPDPSPPGPVPSSPGVPPAGRPSGDPTGPVAGAVRDLLGPVLVPVVRPLAPVVAAVLVPLRPVVDAVTSPSTIPGVTDLVSGAVDGFVPVPPVTPAEGDELPRVELPSPSAPVAPSTTAWSSNGARPSGPDGPDPARVEVVPEPGDVASSAPIEPDPGPGGPASRAPLPVPVGARVPGAERGASPVAVLPTIEIPAVAATGLVTPPSLDEGGAPTVRPGYSPD